MQASSHPIFLLLCPMIFNEHVEHATCPAHTGPQNRAANPSVGDQLPGVCLLGSEASGNQSQVTPAGRWALAPILVRRDPGPISSSGRTSGWSSAPFWSEKGALA